MHAVPGPDVSTILFFGPYVSTILKKEIPNTSLSAATATRPLHFLSGDYGKTNNMNKRQPQRDSYN